MDRNGWLTWLASRVGGGSAALARARGAPGARDPLTGLPTRAALEHVVTEHIVAHAELPADQPDPADLTEPAPYGRRLAVVVLDVDCFRQVNDALGYAAGDRLLVEVARRLSAVDLGLVARIGADEFVVAVPGLADVEQARVVAGRLAAAVRGPVTLDDVPVDLSISAGVAVYPEHGADADTLLRRADLAMRDAKRRGDDVAGYPVGADRPGAGRLRLLADLRRAVTDPTDDGVRLYYQPQLDMRSGAVVGAEALLRWHHPQRGPVDPAELMRVAEHSPVMRLLTMRVIDDVIAQLSRWRGPAATLRVSVNVSVRDLLGTELIDRMADRLVERGVDPSRVQVELTEGALMSDPRAVLSSLGRLHRLGVAIALDDFGTGYSSLLHLRRLPLTEVKIDRSFVLGMTAEPADAAIVGTVVRLGEQLGLRVVAEGVEDERTYRALVEAGCGVAQGWYCARPMPADQLIAWIADHDSRAQVPGRRTG
jgi:diguanylate cyclase (GGDEF)-like protein